ncbi:hypothetical protein D9M68_101360 [compost metagenome]
MSGRFLLTIVATLSAMCAGCASIVGGTSQNISVEARQDAKSIAGAACTLSNDKGKWFVTTPGSVGVQRSYEAMNVTCTKTGSEPGTTAAQSTTKPMAFGNIIFGGLVGAAIDIGSGAAYEYPNLIAVEMKALEIPKPAELGSQALAAPMTIAWKPVPKPAPGPFTSIAEALAVKDMCTPVGYAVLTGTGQEGDTYRVNCMGGMTKEYACAGQSCSPAR